jgi:uncharacterized membrane protein (DUF106 family)
MEHPLIGDLSGLKIEELQHKMSELNKRISFAYKTGNQALLGQLQMVLEAYNREYAVKMAKLMPKGDDDKYGDKIDIS